MDVFLENKIFFESDNYVWRTKFYSRTVMFCCSWQAQKLKSAEAEIKAVANHMV
jgi:hypothetical protein